MALEVVRVLTDQKADDFLWHGYGKVLYPIWNTLVSDRELIDKPFLNMEYRIRPDSHGVVYPFLLLKILTDIPFIYENEIYLWRVSFDYTKPLKEDTEIALKRIKDMMEQEVAMSIKHGKVEDINMVTAHGVPVYQKLDSYIKGYKHETVKEFKQ